MDDRSLFPAPAGAARCAEGGGDATRGCDGRTPADARGAPAHDAALFAVLHVGGAGRGGADQRMKFVIAVLNARAVFAGYVDDPADVEARLREAVDSVLARRRP